MALKEITFSDKKIMIGNNLTNSLCDLKTYYGEKVFHVAKRMAGVGFLPSANLDDIVRFHYGDGDSNDPEFIFARIIVLYFLLSYLEETDYFRKAEFNNNREFLKKNIKLHVAEYFPEYKVDSWDTNNGLLSYSYAETVAVAENLNDILLSDAMLIKELLNIRATDAELIGNISKINSKIEKWESLDLPNLNEVDKGIFKDSLKLSKKIINNVNEAKGHAGRSELTVRDIAHNYALNVSLVFKLKQINDEK